MEKNNKWKHTNSKNRRITKFEMSNGIMWFPPELEHGMPEQKRACRAAIDKRWRRAMAKLSTNSKTEKRAPLHKDEKKAK